MLFTTLGYTKWIVSHDRNFKDVVLYFEHVVEHPYYMFLPERYTCINHPVHLFCWWPSVIASQI